MIEQEALHTRIAPTPSGYIHLGNAFNFVYNKLLSASTGGTTLLRIDDNDALRSQRAFVEDIFMCLDFLGIEWERGPGSVDEFYDKWSQQHRKPLYDEALSRLKDAGKLFACTCSRSRLQRLNSGVYDGYCVNQSRAFFAEETSWRINTERYKRIVFSDLKKGLISVDVNQEIGSFVVRRKDGFAAYQLVSLIDDLHFGINAVVRGKDLLHSTAMQHLLAEALSEKKFFQTKFIHHKLLSNTDGTKLSKSAGSLSIKTMIAEGFSRKTFYINMAEWLGLNNANKIHDFGELLDVSMEEEII